MGMTMTQKILAHAAGIAQVHAGDLIEANLDKSDIYVFSAGEVLNVPDFNNQAADESFYPPWRK